MMNNNKTTQKSDNSQTSNGVNIGVFFGSRSPEHDVSIITGQLVISGLKGLGFEVTPVYLSKKGQWLIGDELGKLVTFSDPKRNIDPPPRTKYRDYYLDLENSFGKLVFKKKGAFGKSITIDLIFPAFHGSYGEDGTIQGLFEIFNIPYVGCDVTSSALTMDKILTKQFCQANKILTTKFLFYGRQDWHDDRKRVIKEIKTKLKWPVFVKPSRLGSSIGIAKVREEQDLELAIEVALHYDQKFLAEESVENLADVTCAVLGNDEPEASLLQESVFSKELFSYEDKYLNQGGAQLGKAEKNIIIPARLNDKKTREVRGLAVKIFKMLGCSGIARVDFLLNKKTGRYYANEVNTLPGTLYHHLWKASGLELPELLKKLLDLALEKHKAKQKITYTFESDLLKQAGSLKLKKDDA